MVGHNDAGLVLGQMLLATQLPAQADQRRNAVAPGARPSAKKNIRKCVRIIVILNLGIPRVRK